MDMSWLPVGGGLLGVITFLIVGLAKGFIYTRPQVIDMKDRYEKHFSDMKEIYDSRLVESNRREGEWREIAGKWQNVAELLSDGMEPMQEQAKATLLILQEWQRTANRSGRRVQ